MSQMPPAPVMPYAGPNTNAVNMRPVAAWSEGDVLVLAKGYAMPDCCVKCAGPTGKRWNATMTWFHPAAYFGLFLGLLPFAIIAVCTQKKETISISICAEHQARRVKFLWIGVSIAILAILLFLIAGMMSELILVIPGIVALIVGVVLAGKGRALTAKKIDEQYLWLKGAGPAYLALLPDIHQASR